MKAVLSEPGANGLYKMTIMAKFIFRPGNIKNQTVNTLAAESNVSMTLPTEDHKRVLLRVKKPKRSRKSILASGSVHVLATRQDLSYFSCRQKTAF